MRHRTPGAVCTVIVASSPGLTGDVSETRRTCSGSARTEDGAPAQMRITARTPIQSFLNCRPPNLPSNSLPGPSYEAVQSGQYHGLDQRRSVRDAGDGQQLSCREHLHHAPGLRLREDVALCSPHDQGRAGEAFENGPEVGPWRRTPL